LVFTKARLGGFAAAIGITAAILSHKAEDSEILVSIARGTTKGSFETLKSFWVLHDKTALCSKLWHNRGRHEFN